MTGGGELGPLIFLIAGEPSGDLLGARLMAALKTETGGRVRFAGVGGELMAAEGLRSLFPLDDLAVMGLVEVLPHIRRIHRRLEQAVEAVQAAAPDALVTIDSPVFTLRVSRRLVGKGFALIHYVAPSVWAWKPWRARQVARYLDHLIALLPFEPPYFEEHGLATSFVGHPAVEAPVVTDDGVAFRRAHGIPPGAPLLCLLPGSRRAEVARLAPVFGRALKLLAVRRADLHALVPTVAGVEGMVRRAVRDWPVPTVVVSGTGDKYRAFAASQLALAASGTVAVELAIAGVPAVIAYRVNPLSAFLARRLIKVDYVSIPNLVMGQEVQPEFLQERCTAENLATALQHLLDDPAARRRQLEGGAVAAQKLGSGGPAPSRRAARSILSVIGCGGGAANTYNEPKPKEEP
jgi:lipid-A-disaccharide synthase